jgi:hypothetical protein
MYLSHERWPAYGDGFQIHRVALAPEIGFVLPKPLAAPICYNSSSTKYLPFPSLWGNWLCLARMPTTERPRAQRGLRSQLKPP